MDVLLFTLMSFMSHVSAQTCYDLIPMGTPAVCNAGAPDGSCCECFPVASLCEGCYTVGCPTRNPTLTPTLPPTLIPTVATHGPTLVTLQPIAATNDPSSIPSDLPSSNPVNPTGMSSYHPTKQPLVEALIRTESTVLKDSNQSVANNDNTELIIAVVCLASIIGMYVIYKVFRIIQKRNTLAVNDNHPIDETQKDSNDEGQNEGQIDQITGGDGFKNDVQAKDDDIVKVVNQTADNHENENKHHDYNIVAVVNETAFDIQ
eukprot:823452_1